MQFFSFFSFCLVGHNIEFLNNGNNNNNNNHDNNNNDNNNNNNNNNDNITTVNKNQIYSTYPMFIF